MALIDIYEVIDVSETAGIPVLNTYHVERDNPAFTATDMARAFEDTLLGLLLPLQTASILHTSITARNLNDDTDFAVRIPSPALGTRIGNDLTPFQAMAIQMNRTTLAINNGQKRILLGREEDTAGITWNASFLTEVGGFVSALLDPWEIDPSPGVPICDYVILKRVCTTQPPPDPCLEFRLPETDGELAFFNPDTAILRAEVSSQVSRKLTR